MEGDLFEFGKDIRTEITFRDSKYWTVEYSSLCVKKHVGDIGERIPLKVKVSIVMSS